jgi:3-oxoacyl-[acyl-carrier protein] reductase
LDLGLKGLRAVVSGGTKGIGRSIVDTFAREGADVAFCARNAEEVAATQSAVAALGVRAFGTALDIADGVALKSWMSGAAAALGGIDIVVANVSAMTLGVDDASWKHGFELDIMGCVRMVDGAMPFLEQTKAASIVSISSVSAREIDFKTGPYGPFKAALVHYTKGLAVQLAPKGIRANSVSPGNTFFEGGIWNRIKDGNPELYKAALARNPTGRMGTPQEMANAVVFLASPAASFITGTNLLVDGALSHGVQL